VVLCGLYVSFGWLLGFSSAEFGCSVLLLGGFQRSWKPESYRTRPYLMRGLDLKQPQGLLDRIRYLHVLDTGTIGSGTWRSDLLFFLLFRADLVNVYLKDYLTDRIWAVLGPRANRS
jgi:hypothetical protein